MLWEISRLFGQEESIMQSSSYESIWTYEHILQLGFLQKLSNNDK